MLEAQKWRQLFISIAFKFLISIFKHVFNLQILVKTKKKNLKIAYMSSLSFFFKYDHINNISATLAGLDVVLVSAFKFYHLARTTRPVINRWSFRATQTNNGATAESLSYNKSVNTTTVYFLYGLKSIWLAVRFWFLSLVLGLTIFYVLMLLKFVPLLKISFQWLSIVMFLYWLFSGFVFFIKKYQTSKFTTVIQRFWRRTYIIFWLIETCVFVTFLYVTFNASQEPFYMHDQIKVFKNHLFSWRYFLIKVVAVAILVIVGYVLLLFLKWNIYTKQSVFFFFISLFLTYVVWLEFYQFFHIISYYSGLFWVFDEDDRVWVLENDFNRTRLVNNYVALCLMAKFWHLIFIYVFWIFFVLRSNELQRYRYPMLSANLQNFIILYIFCWLFMYPWFKLYIRKYMDYNYYWFFTNSREIGLRIFFTDIKLFFYGCWNFFFSQADANYKFYNLNFFYWISSGTDVGFDAYRKHFIKSAIISSYYSNVF